VGSQKKHAARSKFTLIESKKIHQVGHCTVSGPAPESPKLMTSIKSNDFGVEIGALTIAIFNLSEIQ
jgi:hypothetical protein